MEIKYSGHAIMRMKQRGITDIIIKHLLKYPTIVIKVPSRQRFIAIGKLKERKIKIVYSKEENYLKIISVM